MNGQRIVNQHLNALGEFGKNPQGRQPCCLQRGDRQGREYVMGLMRAAKLDVSIDLAGNIIRPSNRRVPTLPSLLFGSHIDTVPEAATMTSRWLARSDRGCALSRNRSDDAPSTAGDIFQNEEGGLIGSRALDGELRAGTGFGEPER